MLFSKTIFNRVDIFPIINNRPIIKAFILLSIGINTLHAEEPKDTLSTAYSLVSTFPYLITYSAEQAKLNVEQALILNKENSIKVSALGNSCLGVYSTIKGENIATIKYHNKALCFYNELENQDRQVLVLNELGIVYKNISKYKKCIDIYRQGINAYLLKNAKKDELLIAVKNIVCGENYFSKEVHYIHNEGSFKSDYSTIPKLSKREQEVLKLMGDEFTSKQIADILFISQNTLEPHPKNMFSKLSVKNVADLIKMDIKNNLLVC